MPALVVCGKKTFLGGDDLRVYTVFAIALRLLQLVALIPLTKVVARSSKTFKFDPSCPNNKIAGLVNHAHQIVVLYVSFGFLLTCLGIGIEVGIWRTSGKGAPTEQEARRKLKPLCLTKMIPMSFLRAVVLALGLMCLVIVNRYCQCGTVDYTTKCPLYPRFIAWFSIAWISHAVEACVVGLYALYFACKAKPKTPKMLSAETKWKLCCQCCCTVSSILTCCLAGGRDAHGSDFADVALVLADFFDSGGIVDVVPSDIMVGFRMLRRVHKKRQLECGQETIRRCSIQVSKLPIQEKDEEMGEATPMKEADDASPMESAAAEIQQLDEGSETDSQESDQEDGKKVDFELAKLVVAKNELENEPEDNKMQDSQVKDRRAMLKRQMASRALVYQMHRKNGKVFFRPTQRVVLSRRNPEDRMAIAQGARFIRYAWAIYGFKSFQYKGHLRFEAVRDKRDEVMGGAKVHESRLLAATGLKQCEIVYAQFSEGLAMTPYAICIDHAWKSVVVTIRGTVSLDDVVADLTLTPASLEETGAHCGFDGRDCYVHNGMLRCTTWIYNDIESHGCLQKLLLDEDARVPDYQLVLTGHSLGAGCASILSFMLKSKFPTLRCLAFSVPGCTMSENMAESCKSYLTSYVLDTDIVPRLSLESMEHLRDDIYEMVARIKVPKIDANRAKKDVDEVDRLLHSKDSIPPSEFSEGLDNFKERLKKKKSEKLVNVPLYPPGNIVQLVKTSEDEKVRSGCLCTRENLEFQEQLPYAARWAQRDDLAEVVISSHFVDDHSSTNVLRELERVAELFQISPPYTIDAEEAQE